MDPIKEYLKLETRRQFFGKCASGLGGAALATLLPNAVVNALEAQAKTEIRGFTRTPALCTQSETGRLPLYVRGTLTTRSVRLQTEYGGMV